jgi:hypothetical protein
MVVDLMQNQTRLCLQTDRQTDRQTDDILKPVNPPLNFVIILSGFALGQQPLYFVCIYVLGHGVAYKNMIIMTDIKCQDQMNSLILPC